MSQKPIFLLIDGHAVIYRAYYGYPGLTTSSGLLVNAVYGFTRILLSAIRNFEPVFIAVTFDHPSQTFRQQEFADYKAQRPEMPMDLRPQVEIIKQIVSALNIPQFEMPGYEADDLIGTICRLVSEGDFSNGNGMANSSLQTIVVTGDKDAFQLVDDDTHVWLPARSKFQSDREYDEKAVVEKMGVTPAQIIDLKALMGDSSDNIPGIKGVGPKLAQKLIAEFGTLEGIYEFLDAKLQGEFNFENVESADSLELENNAGFLKDLSSKLGHDVLKGSSLKKIILGKKSAFLSQKLATIDINVPLVLDLESCRVTSYDKNKIVDLLLEYDFKSLIDMLPDDEFQLAVQDALF